MTYRGWKACPGLYLQSDRAGIQSQVFSCCITIPSTYDIHCFHVLYLYNSCEFSIGFIPKVSVTILVAVNGPTPYTRVNNMS